MPLYILHFDCRPLDPAADTAALTAEACALAPSLPQAEALARETIEAHAQRAGDLIAFAELEETQSPSLSERETTLYLKALQHNPHCAVLFTHIG